ncbi:hypothetical protein JCM11641_001791 [Rhodosporidiobolus odoratus]
MEQSGDLIRVVNRLQETFSTVGGETVDLPQIVVVGSQSAGKSSVLETIVGRDFLPRGQGIVTRRPLVLQLVHTPSTRPAGEEAGEGSSEECGEFLHLDKRFFDFAEIRKEIENETLRVAGGNKGISRLPIHLKIFSPHVLNLTLVDLPGLTKIPVGDQPTDIERQIRNLVLDYVGKPNCVILAISPANVDLANSESLKLARAVDPQGRRTIGVLTKLDLMDAGTNALDILTGRVYPLKLGFIGVVGRSQADILSGKEMREQVRSEEKFFENHGGYRNIAHRCGTKFLAKTLNQVLMNHIRDKLPDMKARLNTLMGQTQQELAAFGDLGASQTPSQRGALILHLMTQFVRDFVASIDGTALEISTKELCGGARIYHIFHDVFGHALQSINPTVNLTTQDIRTAIRNSTGPRPSLFVPEQAFDLLIKPQIRLLEPPSLRCVELVYEELMKICHNCTSAQLQRYPRLHAQLIEVVSELLRERLGPTSEYVQSLISIQAAYINTNHPEFVEGSARAARESARGGALAAGKGRPTIEDDELHSSSNPDSDTEGGGGADSATTTSTANGGLNGGYLVPSSSGSASERPSSRQTSATHPHTHPSSSANSDSSSILPPGSLPPSAASGAGQAGGAKHRAASSSLHDRPVVVPPHPSSSSSTLVGGSSSRYPYAHNHNNNPYSSAPSSAFTSSPYTGGGGSMLSNADRHATAKESFLNYFFGGAASGAGGALSGERGRGVVGSGGSLGGGASASGGSGGGNPLQGRKGLEGNAAAFEMKSLERHLEPAAPTLSSSSAQGTASGLTPREEMETSLIRALIASYFGIVRQTIEDLVPKAVMHLLVNHSRETIQNRLVASLYKEGLFDELLHEDEALTNERKRVEGLLKAYREAFQTLSEVL